MCRSGSRQRLKSSGLSGQPCFTPLLQLILLDVPRGVVILVLAPSYILVTIDCTTVGSFIVFITSKIRLCGTEPKAFVQSMVVAMRSLLVRLACAIISFRRILCSVQPLHFWMKPFWVRVRNCSCVFSCWSARAIRAVKIR